jgi:hypothetical protein
METMRKEQAEIVMLRSLMKNKYKILVGSDGRATLIGSKRFTLEISTNLVKDLKNLLGIS